MKSLLNSIKYCKQCGVRILLHGYNDNNRLNHIMKKKSICYDCAYWNNLLNHPPEYFEVIGNTCLRIHPVVETKDKSMILGGKGKTRYFIRPDKTLFKSNDIWSIGKIPERFSAQFKKTATEISKRAFFKLSTNNKKCKARACFDRYDCWRYDIDLEKEKGPYNNIPPKWKKGGEHCRYFIGFDDILSD